jgi:hypothetical protein
VRLTISQITLVPAIIFVVPSAWVLYILASGIAGSITAWTGLAAIAIFVEGSG